MARLPTPGQDHNQWGDILNDYLLQSHTTTGSLKANTVSTSQITDDTVTEDKLSNDVRTKLNTGGGTQGPVGPAGPIGPTGPVGPQGPQGPAGLTGPTGPIGLQGPAGTNGTNGQDGAPGPAGTPGAQGPAGPQGEAGTTTWAGITDKPAVIGAGATQAAARSAIGAGTSNLALGATDTTAKPGNWTPAVADIPILPTSKITGLDSALATAVAAGRTKWVEGRDAPPTLPLPAGSEWEVWIGADSPRPSWVPNYTPIFRVGSGEENGGGGTGPTGDPVTAELKGQFTSTSNTTTSGAISIGSIPVGTPILVLVAGGGNSVTLGVTNGNGGTWEQLGVSTVDSIAGTVAAYRTVAASSATDTITVTRAAAGGLSVAVYALDSTDGVLAGSPVVSKSEANANNATSASVSATRNALVIFAVATGHDVTALTAAGTTDIAAQFSASGAGNPRTLAVGFDSVSTAGQSAPGLSWTSFRAWASITLVINSK